MKADLEDALIPVHWAQAQIPVVQERFLFWQRSYDLMMAAVVGRHIVTPGRAPNFPIRESSSDFFERVEKLKTDKWITVDEAGRHERN